MTRLTVVVRGVIVACALGMFLAGSAYAGSAVVGSVAGGVDTTLRGQSFVPNATVFSGDSLQVKEGVAVIALGRGSRLVFGRESTVSFSREADSVTAVLGQGNVSLFHPEAGVGMQVKVGEVMIAPAQGFKTLGEVAMANGTVVVTTKEGLLRVEENGQAVEVAKGKTVVVTPKTARAAQGGGGGHGHSANGVEIAAVAVGAGGAVLGALGIHAGNQARDSANAATGAANAATAAANAASAAAVAAANAAKAAADAAAARANAVGCALNQDEINQGRASTYHPEPTYSCPPMLPYGGDVPE